MLTQTAGVRPGQSFSANARGLQKGARMQQRVAARPATAMATAALDEVPSPEKRVRSLPGPVQAAISLLQKKGCVSQALP